MKNKIPDDANATQEVVFDIDLDDPNLPITTIVKRLLRKSWQSMKIAEQVEIFMAAVRKDGKKKNMTRVNYVANAYRAAIKKYRPDEKIWAALVTEKKSPAQRQIAKKEQVQEVLREVNALPANKVKHLPVEISFAINNIHRIPDHKDPDTWGIRPKEAPNVACWQMLMLAASNKAKFLDIVTKELLEAQKVERQQKREDEKEKRAFDMKMRQQQMEHEHRVKMKEMEIAAKEKQAEEAAQAALAVAEARKQAAMPNPETLEAAEQVEEDAGIEVLEQLSREIMGE